MDKQPPPSVANPEGPMDDFEDLPTELQTAIVAWTSGNPIPLDLAADLMGLGYDVTALEAQYLTN